MVCKSIERKLFQEKGILGLAQLSPSDEEIERRLLAKRYTLINDGLRVYNGKRVIVKSWNIFGGKRATVPILE